MHRFSQHPGAARQSLGGRSRSLRILLEEPPARRACRGNPANARRQKVDAAGSGRIEAGPAPSQAASASTARAAAASRHSAFGLFSISRMGLDMRSSISSRAGVIAWAGICRRISTGSDRGVGESRNPASSDSAQRFGRTRLQGALHRASGNLCRFAVGFRCTRWMAAALMTQI